MPDGKDTDVKPDSAPVVVPEIEEDSGFGLSEFLESKPSPEEAADAEDDDPPAGVVKEPEKDDDKKPDKEPDKEPDKKADPDAEGKDKPPVKADDKPSADPVKPPDKDEGKKPEEKPPEGKKPEEKPPEGKKPEEKPPDKKPEEKPEEKLKVDYESEDNVYKKRYRDTSNWATNLNKQVVDQNKEIVILKKKAEGTYDEELDNPPPDPEVIQAEAESHGRSLASRDAAVGLFGEESVAKDLLKFKDVFGQDIHMQGSVMASEQPVIEAIKAVRRYEFFEEYGSDPIAIKEKIKANVLAESTDKLRETIRDEEQKKLADRIKTKGDEVTGLAKLASKTDHKVEKKGVDSLDVILSS